MFKRFCMSLSAAIAVAAFTMAGAGAQTGSPIGSPPAPNAIVSGWHAQFSKVWTPPRTPWGDPDLQGNFTWVDELDTPFERPAEFEGRSLTDITPAEMETINKKQREKAAAEGPTPSVPSGWYETEYQKNTRAWYIIDPPDGALPPLTAEAAAIVAARRDPAQAGRYASVPSSRTAKGTNLATYLDWGQMDRCISDGGPMEQMYPQIYGNSVQIIQTPDYVVMRYEMMHETRILPIKGRGGERPLVPYDLRSYFGDGLAWFEGNTLVVDWVFHQKQEFHNSPWIGTPAGSTRTIERFTRRTAPSGIEYTATTINPAWWARPWTWQQRLTEDDRQLVFEYNCHETNYSIVNALSGARDEERREAQRRAKAEQRAREAGR